MSRLLLTLSAFLLGSATSLAGELPPFAESPLPASALHALREGGHVLYMRHGNTDASRPDRAPQVDLKDCATQRPLTEEGRQVAARVGDALRRARIPLGEIWSSPLCRATESARAAFGKGFAVESKLMYTANMTSEEKKPIVEKTRELVSRPVPGRSNRVIVSHAPNLMDMMGYFPVPEGTVVVFQPQGGGQYKYLGSVTPQQWDGLLQQDTPER